MSIQYHGSKVIGLTELKPFSKAHNTIKSSVVYLTPSETYALLYIWGKPYKWVTFSVDSDGIVSYTEQFQEQLQEFYKGVCGCIYSCDGNNKLIHPTHIANVFNAEEPVPVLQSRYIADVYAEILKCESEGKIRIKRYAELSDEEKDALLNSTVRAIHMERLLYPTENQETLAKIEFVKTHFPQAWGIASSQTDSEVKEMIDQWRKQRGV